MEYADIGRYGRLRDLFSENNITIYDNTDLTIKTSDSINSIANKARLLGGQVLKLDDDITIVRTANKVDILSPKKIRIKTYSYNEDLSDKFPFSHLKLRKLDISDVSISGYKKLTGLFSIATIDEVILPDNLDTLRVSSYAATFNQSTIKNIELSKIDTSKAVDMSNMFCHARMNLDGISNWNTSKLRVTDRMFYGVKADTIDLSNWNFEKLQSAASMFMFAKIKYLNVGNLNLRQRHYRKHGEQKLFCFCEIEEADFSNLVLCSRDWNGDYLMYKSRFNRIKFPKDEYSHQVFKRLFGIVD